MNNLICESKSYNLSTRGSAGNILNLDPNYKSQIEYNIPDMIVRDDSIEYIQFSIPYAVIPVSFYNVNQNNNILYVLENGIPSTYVFPQGNYTANSFINEFTNLLGNQWTISLNTFNSIFTITNSSNTFSLFKASSISSVMGFSSNLLSSLVNNVNTLVLSRCCNFFSLPRVCIRSSQLITNNYIVGNNNNASDLLISIPNNAKPNGQIYYINQSQMKSLYRGNNLSRFIVSFTDDDNNLINFNGISSFFTLQIDFFRRFVPIPPNFNNILKYVNSNSFNLPDEEIIETE
jgi:hypothetical protein